MDPWFEFPQMCIRNLAGNKPLKVISINHNCRIRESRNARNVYGLTEKQIGCGYQTVTTIYQGHGSNIETPGMTCLEITDWLEQADLNHESLFEEYSLMGCDLSCLRYILNNGWERAFNATR